MVTAVGELKGLIALQLVLRRHTVQKTGRILGKKEKVTGQG